MFNVSTVLTLEFKEVTEAAPAVIAVPCVVLTPSIARALALTDVISESVVEISPDKAASNESTDAFCAVFNVSTAPTLVSTDVFVASVPANVSNESIEASCAVFLLVLPATTVSNESTDCTRAAVPPPSAVSIESIEALTTVKLPSIESTDDSTRSNLPSTALAEGIWSDVTLAQLTVFKKSAICLDLNCDMLYINVFACRRVSSSVVYILAGYS